MSTYKLKILINTLTILIRGEKIEYISYFWGKFKDQGGGS
jgi:hypothetical protein